MGVRGGAAEGFGGCIKRFGRGGVMGDITDAASIQEGGCIALSGVGVCGGGIGDYERSRLKSGVRPQEGIALMGVRVQVPWPRGIWVGQMHYERIYRRRFGGCVRACVRACGVTRVWQHGAERQWVSSACVHVIVFGSRGVTGACGQAVLRSDIDNRHPSKGSSHPPRFVSGACAPKERDSMHASKQYCKPKSTN